MKLPLEYIIDPGHGWLKVSLKAYPDALASGSGYGYLTATHAYLEEDVEMGHFLLTHPEVDPTTVPVRHVEYFHAPSPIRSIPRHIGLDDLRRLEEARTAAGNEGPDTPVGG